MDLSDVRKNIDRVDGEIRRLFVERMTLADQVACIKAKTEDKIYKPDREEVIIKKQTEGMKPELVREYTALIKRIMEVSRKYQYGRTLELRQCFPFEYTKVPAVILKPAMVRELTGGLYFGERHTEEIDGVRTAVDTLSYNENEIRRIAIKAFDIARKRKKHVISVDKANVLDSSRLWRTVVEEVAKDYEDVTYEHMLVDNCAMQLVNNPRQFDVILTENMFGDILSDEASMITGSIGMLSSASLAEGKFGLYEPSHGSAPDIAGQDIANPIATILSAAMMLRYSFDLDKEADEIEKAVKAVLADGYRTVDIMSDGMKKVGCKEMGQLIIDQIK